MEMNNKAESASSASAVPQSELSGVPDEKSNFSAADRVLSSKPDGEDSQTAATQQGSNSLSKGIDTSDSFQPSSFSQEGTSASVVTLPTADATVSQNPSSNESIATEKQSSQSTDVQQVVSSTQPDPVISSRNSPPPGDSDRVNPINEQTKTASEPNNIADNQPEPAKSTQNSSPQDSHRVNDSSTEHTNPSSEQINRPSESKNVSSNVVDDQATSARTSPPRAPKGVNPTIEQNKTSSEQTVSDAAQKNPAPTEVTPQRTSGDNLPAVVPTQNIDIKKDIPASASSSSLLPSMATVTQGDTSENTTKVTGVTSSTAVKGNEASSTKPREEAAPLLPSMSKIGLADFQQMPAPSSTFNRSYPQTSPRSTSPVYGAPSSSFVPNASSNSGTTTTSSDRMFSPSPYDTYDRYTPNRPMPNSSGNTIPGGSSFNRNVNPPPPVPPQQQSQPYSYVINPVISTRNSPPPPPSRRVTQSAPARSSQPSSGPPSKSGNQKFSKQKHAMHFLYKVRDQYSQTPRVYAEFLDIMKGFKCGSIGTPTVIARVKKLFKGNDVLIEEFNEFLPEGYKIEPDSETSGPRSQPSGMPPDVSPIGMMSSVARPGFKHDGSSKPPGMIGAGKPPIGPGNTQADLDQARNYVRKIKNRFANNPHVYKTFLEILHSYYQGHHAIKDVLEEVDRLFKSHKDLLEEFRRFLPKSLASNAGIGGPLLPTDVPEKKPKKKKKSEANQNTKAKAGATTNKVTANIPASAAPSLIKGNQTTKTVQPPPKKVKTLHPARRPAPDYAKAPPVSQQLGKPSDKPRNFIQQQKQDFHSTNRLSNRDADNRKNKRVKEDRLRDKSRVASRELTFFQQVKTTLRSKTLYHEFLISLRMFSQDLITKYDLVKLVGYLLPGGPGSLFESFKQFIGYDGPDPPEAIKHKLPIDKVNKSRLSNGDLAGLDGAIQSVGGADGAWLNQHMMSNAEMMIANGVEEEHQEELEMVIELNNRTIRELEERLEQSEKSSTALMIDAVISLDLFHLRSIQRMYGDRVIEPLYSNPEAAIPVILKRLKQKNLQLQKALKQLQS